MDSCAMIERCGRHQHPELFGRKAVDPPMTRAIIEMATDRAPLPPIGDYMDRLRHRGDELHG
jgi:hypothetical protein